MLVMSGVFAVVYPQQTQDKGKDLSSPGQVSSSKDRQTPLALSHIYRQFRDLNPPTHTYFRTGTPINNWRDSHLWPLVEVLGFSSPSCLAVPAESPSCLSSWSDRSHYRHHPPPWSPHRCRTRQLHADRCEIVKIRNSKEPILLPSVQLRKYNPFDYKVDVLWCLVPSLCELQQR